MRMKKRTKRKIFLGSLIKMGKTYRHNSDDNQRRPRPKGSNKKGSKKGQQYADYRYDTVEETESHWDEYVEDGDRSFEKFTPKKRKR